MTLLSFRDNITCTHNRINLKYLGGIAMKKMIRILVVLSAMLFIISCSSTGVTYDNPQDIIKDDQATLHDKDHDF